jgi:molecular chaperone DnaJ
MRKPDYYETLGVRRNVDADGLKAAFLKIARENNFSYNRSHRSEIDIHETENRFAAASEAYSVLKDPYDRAMYDLCGHKKKVPVNCDPGLEAVAKELFGTDSFAGVYADFQGNSGFVGLETLLNDAGPTPTWTPHNDLGFTPAEPGDSFLKWTHAAPKAF